MTTHKSDCATHNAPAMEPGPCDCGARLTEIRARADAATEGPWSFVWCHSSGMVAKGDYPPHDITSRDLGPFEWLADGDDSDEDCKFIAHARTDIPYLLSEIDRLRGEIGAVDQVLAHRTALDGIPDRVDKIIHALNTAGKAEPKQ